jgi:hypothetical protein
MADSFAMERFKARLLPKAPPAPVYRGVPMAPELRVQLLMRAVTMAEITAVAARLGLTFNEAYRERAQLWSSPSQRADFTSAAGSARLDASR